VPQDSGRTSLHWRTMAAVTCKHLYKLTSCRDSYGGYCHVHILLTSFFDGILRSAQILYIPISTATLDGRTQQQSHFSPTYSIRSTGLYPVCWMSSHKELPRLHPAWLHPRTKSYLDYILSQRVVSFLPRAWHTSGDARVCSQQVRSVRPGPT
jgi:hypothetical protein